MRAQEALEKANEDLKLAKEAFEKANERAKRTKELLKEAEKQAEEADKFRAKMEEAKVEAQNAIDLMNDAEREAELARLEAASAKATLDAIEKTREVEDYAKEERKRAIDNLKIIASSEKAMAILEEKNLNLFSENNEIREKIIDLSEISEEAKIINSEED